MDLMKVQYDPQKRAELVTQRAALETERADLAERCHELRGKSEENPDWNSADMKQFVVSAMDEIGKAAAIAKIDAELANMPERRIIEIDEPSPMARWIAKGNDGLAEDEAKAFAGTRGDRDVLYSDQYDKYVIQAGYPQSYRRENLDYRAVATKTTDRSGTDSHAVPHTVAPDISLRKKYFGSVASVSRVMTTNAATVFTFPNLDETADAKVGKDQTTQGTPDASDVDLDVIGGEELRAQTTNSNFINVQAEALEDITAFSLPELIDAALMRRIARRLNLRMTITQTGNQVQGVVNGAANNFTTDKAFSGSGSQQYPDWLEFYAAQNAIDAAYIENGEGNPDGFSDPTMGSTAWMMHQNGRFQVLSAQDSQKRPLYLPSIRERAGSMLAGYPLILNNAMAVPANSAKAFLFGWFGAYLVRFVGTSRVERIRGKDEAAKNQYAFIAFRRWDSTFVEAISASSASAQNRAALRCEALATLTYKA